MIGSATWIDDVLSDSFPASDPPSWIPGIVRPAPAKPDPGEVTADGLEDEERPAARVRPNPGTIYRFFNHQRALCSLL